MAGIASKGLQAQKCWPRVHRSLPGWVKIIQQWLRVQSQEKSALMSLEYVANRQSTLKLKTAPPTLFTSWPTPGVGEVAHVIVVLTNAAITCEICFSAAY